MKYCHLLLFFLLGSALSAQVYTEKQTRHRFAQLNLGVAYQTNAKGSTRYLGDQGGIETMDLGPLHNARFLIGGTHFWGHADFYISIPLLGSAWQENGQEIFYTSGVETAFKFYPWRIEHRRWRPFLGVALASFYYRQNNQIRPMGNGPELSHTSWPLTTGLTFNHGNHLWEAGLLWNYANRQDYYISRIDRTEITTPPLYFSLSYRYMLETTLSAEKDWESGRTAQATDILAGKGALNGFYFGAGLSSVFWIGSNSYNRSERPYIPKYDNSLLPDLTLGYYWYRPDLNAALSYRNFRTSAFAYGALQRLHRRSLGLEVAKYLFDYHGFVPFIGPVISREQLSFEESFDGRPAHDITDNRISAGLTFGWDIRPNRLQSFLLRTNLRWYPKLELEVQGGQTVSFSSIEFNFIQLVLFPGRFF